MLASARSARAHSVNVDAFAEGNSITVEAYFGDGKPVANATVRVLSQASQEARSGTTDEAGRFRFQPGGPEPLTVEVVQAGHKGTVLIDTETLEQLAGATVVIQPYSAASSAPAAPPGSVAVPLLQPGRVVRRTMHDSPIVPAIAGIALILSAACLWRMRMLARQVEELRRQLQQQTGSIDKGPR